MLPDTLEAGAPAGYSLNLHVPQNSEPERLGTPNVKKVIGDVAVGHGDLAVRGGWVGGLHE